MNKSLSCALALLGPALAAQVPPGVFTPPGLDQVFTESNLQNLGIYRAGATQRDIEQISFCKTPNVDLVGQWTVCLTVRDLSTTYGGPGNNSNRCVVMGTYDTNTNPPRFIPNLQANQMNSPLSADNFGLMMEPREVICCTVNQDSGVYFSVRPTVRAAFPTPVRVTSASGTPLIPRGNVDAVPIFLDDVLGMMYTDPSVGIVFREFRLSWSPTNTLTAAEVLKVQTLVPASAQRPHSPSPIIDARGNLQGLLMARASGNDSDVYFLSCINGFDQPQLVFDSPGWAAHGGVAGGRLFWASDAANSSAVTTQQATWLVGSHTALGGTATMTVGCINPNASSTTQIALSFSLNNGVQSGVAIPGLGGLYGLQGTVLVFVSANSNDLDGISGWQNAVPNVTALRGIRISVQGLSASFGSPPTFTNTATLSFK